MTTQVRHKTTDAKGRVTLGGHFANRAVIVERQGDDAVVVRLARVIPEREAWLYESPNALTVVRRGLDQARKGHVAKSPPDLKTAAKLAAQLDRHCPASVEAMRGIDPAMGAGERDSIAARSVNRAPQRIHARARASQASASLTQ